MYRIERDPIFLLLDRMQRYLRSLCTLETLHPDSTLQTLPFQIPSSEQIHILNLQPLVLWINVQVFHLCQWTQYSVMSTDGVLLCMCVFVTTFKHKMNAIGKPFPHGGWHSRYTCRAAQLCKSKMHCKHVIMPLHMQRERTASATCAGSAAFKICCP